MEAIYNYKHVEASTTKLMSPYSEPKSKDRPDNRNQARSLGGKIEKAGA